MLNAGVSDRLIGLSRVSRDIAGKLLAVLFFSVILVTLALMNAPSVPRDMAPGDFHISWISSLAATLQQGQISGRDFYYTYGLLSQALAYLAVTLTSSNSALAGFPGIVVAFRTVGVVLLGLILISVRRVSAAQSVLIYVCFILLNIFSSTFPLALVFTYRALALLLCGILLVRVLATTKPERRVTTACLLGVAYFGLQLTTSELAIYAVLSTIAVCCLFAFAAWRPSILRRNDLLAAKDYVVVAVISIGVLVGLNLLTDIIFKLTSDHYASLLDYQTYTWQLISGYGNTMGVQWGLSTWPTVTLFGMAFFSMGSVSLRIRKMDLGNCYLTVSLLAFSLAFSRQATLRSDVGHILSGFVPVILTFLLLVPELKNRLLLAMWAGLFVLLIITWPTAGWTGIAQLGQVLAGKPVLSDKVQLISKGGDVPQTAADLALTLGDSSRPMLNFPSENYLSIALDRGMVAPVILAHNAHTPALQQEYVKALDKQYGKLDVTYSLDDVSSVAIDDVQHITRLPIIFEYLYSNYTLKTDRMYGRGIYVLAPRPQHAMLYALPLETQTQAWDGDRLVARLAQPAQCTLVRLTLNVDYPVTRLLGRPNPLLARFNLDDTIVQESGLVAIETGVPFTTYISLLNPPSFYRVFDGTAKPDKDWNSLVITQRSTGMFQVSPTTVVLKKVECVNG